jgi:hypothetical protein
VQSRKPSLGALRRLCGPGELSDHAHTLAAKTEKNPTGGALLIGRLLFGVLLCYCAPMRSSKDVESYLLRMGRPFKDTDDGTTFVVNIDSVRVAVKLAPPLLLARVEIGAVPAKDREKLFGHLLKLNATALVHSAYGLDGDRIVLAAALELENLDYNELDAVLAEVDLALVQQLPEIRSLAGHAPPAAPAKS